MTDNTVKLAMKMDFDEIFQLAAGFGGGVGLQGHICGAVSGAVAALGVINGRKFGDVNEHKEATYESAAKFMQMFKEMGFTETALGVDAENTSGALNLYKCLGYTVSKKHTTYRKEMK